MKYRHFHPAKTDLFLKRYDLPSGKPYLFENIPLFSAFNLYCNNRTCCCKCNYACCYYRKYICCISGLNSFIRITACLSLTVSALYIRRFICIRWLLSISARLVCSGFILFPVRLFRVRLFRVRLFRVHLFPAHLLMNRCMQVHKFQIYPL